MMKWELRGIGMESINNQSIYCTPYCIGYTVIVIIPHVSPRVIMLRVMIHCNVSP